MKAESEVKLNENGIFDFEDLDSFIDEHDAEIVEAEEGCSSTEALFKSLDTKGTIDFDYMTRITGLGFERLVSDLYGVIYQDPRLWDEDERKGWVLGSDYLSGNLITRLDEANRANEKYNMRFDENVKALKKLLRPEIDSSNIHLNLGASWVPGRIYDEFLLHLAGIDPVKGRYPANIEKFFSPEYQLQFVNTIGAWYIPFKNRFCYFRKVKPYLYDIYGTYTKDMVYLLEDTMNLKTPKITYTAYRPDGSNYEAVDNEETLKLIERQKKITDEFNLWVWSDETRKSILVSAYMTRFGNIRCKVYDGSFLTFPGMSDGTELYQ